MYVFIRSIRLVLYILIVDVLLLAPVNLYGICVNNIEGEEKMKEDSSIYKEATFAGGCFWCIEAAFEEVEGIKEVISGYTGGTKENPTYKEVSTGRTGHYEAVQITYNPDVISYKELLYIFWKNIDPTDSEGQFVDKGSQYRTAIFYHNTRQRELAEESKEELDRKGIFGRPIMTEIKKYNVFYKAEEYHQDYYRKCPLKYKNYKFYSGRVQFLEEIWGGEQDGE